MPCQFCASATALTGRRPRCGPDRSTAQRKCNNARTFDGSIRKGILHHGKILRPHDWVVELVGLEPTTRVLWNMRVFDQLTWSNTRHSNSRGPLFIDISTNGNPRLPSGRESPVSRARSGGD